MRLPCWQQRCCCGCLCWCCPQVYRRVGHEQCARLPAAPARRRLLWRRLAAGASPTAAARARVCSCATLPHSRPCSCVTPDVSAAAPGGEFVHVQLGFELGNELITHLAATNNTADIIALAGIIQDIWSDVPAANVPPLYAPSTGEVGGVHQHAPALCARQTADAPCCNHAAPALDCLCRQLPEQRYVEHVRSAPRRQCCPLRLLRAAFPRPPVCPSPRTCHSSCLPAAC